MSKDPKVNRNPDIYTYLWIPVKWQPLDIVVEDDPRGHEKLCEVIDIYTLLFVLLKLYTRVL